MSANYKIIETFDGFYIKVLGKVDLNLLSQDLTRRRLNVDISNIMREMVNAKVGQEILLLAKKEDFSAPVIIAIAPGKMSAVLTLNIKPGKKIPLEEVFQKIKDQQIVNGVDLERIKMLLSLKRPTFREVIATGEPPQTGLDAYIEYKYTKPNLDPLLDKDDYLYERGKIIAVQKGDILAVKTPATIGVLGCNVLGEIIQPLPGKDMDFNLGEGISVEINTALAVTNGALEWNDSILEVVPMKILKGDDIKGEILAPGKVMVLGNLPEQAHIIARNDIEIQGNIEGATVVSEKGSVFVRGGIIGNDRNIIQAAGNIESRFVSRSILEVGKNLVVDEYIFSSRISLGEGVYCRAVKEHTLPNRGSKKKGVPDMETIPPHNMKLVRTRLKKLEREMRTLFYRIKDLTSKTSSSSEVPELLTQYFDLSATLNQFRSERQHLLNLQVSKGLGILGLLLGPGVEYRVRYERVPPEKIATSSTIFYDQRKNRLMILE